MVLPTAKPRLRLIQWVYLSVLLLVASSHGPALGTVASVLLQGLAFSLVVIAVLGRLWISAFIAGHKDESLVQHGPFAACRHPLYLCSIIGAAGIGLASGRLLLALALPIIMALILVRTAGREDQALAQRHGQRWQDYAARVPAFWPRGSLLQYPAEVPLQPGLYRKAYFDAASFLGLWLLVVVTDALRQALAWPVLFSLP